MCGVFKSAALILAILGWVCPTAFALEQIIRPFQSPRSSGMGGLRLMTGLYEENFFGNPARTSSNPKKRVQLFDLMFETSSGTLSNISNISGGGGSLSKFSKLAGKNNHFRLQTSFPGFYWDAGGKWNYAMAWLMSSQLDLAVRNSYRIDPGSITDIGPAISASRKLLDNENLRLGATFHLAYRLSTPSQFGFIDIFRGASLTPQKTGGENGHVDFDFGGTYYLPKEYWGWKVSTGASVTHILDGHYRNVKVIWLNNGRSPRQQPRSYGFGIAAEKPALWKFTDTIVGLEFSDIGNNPDGSLFRTLHLGGETHWKSLRPRLGINQGYWTAGLGFNWRAIELELATYGEEMSLNVGQVEDRRYVFRLSIAI